MTKVSSTPVTKQPGSYEIYSNFAVMGNEKVLYQCTEEKGSCGSKNIYYTTLTDARLLIRIETTNCCNQEDYIDVSISLRDIAVIRQCRESRGICRCCGISKLMELRGTFGSKRIPMTEKDMIDIQLEMSARIGNHKLISHH
jgi:hypothetical protein